MSRLVSIELALLQVQSVKAREKMSWTPRHGTQTTVPTVTTEKCNDEADASGQQGHILHVSCEYYAPCRHYRQIEQRILSSIIKNRHCRGVDGLRRCRVSNDALNIESNSTVTVVIRTYGLINGSEEGENDDAVRQWPRVATGRAWRWS